MGDGKGGTERVVEEKRDEKKGGGKVGVKRYGRRKGQWRREVVGWEVRGMGGKMGMG